MTGGRCVSVRYRLAPQHPFPAALLDVLVTYLSLLFPPPGSFHESISASDIMIAGDSAGANLCLALIQLILQLHRDRGPESTIKFFGRDVRMPLPAGVASFSAWTDHTQALPSYTANQTYDYFSQSALERVPPCEIWPASPPRGTMYCEIPALCHPLVSPTIAKDWTGAPPLFFCCGQEMLVDNSKIIAQRAVSQGCTVLWAEYDTMPHCFPFIFDIPQTEDSFARWAKFCQACVNRPSTVTSQGVGFDKNGNTRSVDVANLIDLSFEEVEHRMRRKMQDMLQAYQRKVDAHPKL